MSEISIMAHSQLTIQYVVCRCATDTGSVHNCIDFLPRSSACSVVAHGTGCISRRQTAAAVVYKWLGVGWWELPSFLLILWSLLLSAHQLSLFNILTKMPTCSVPGCSSSDRNGASLHCPWIKARAYAYAIIEYVRIRTYYSNRIRVWYAYSIFEDLK